MTTPKMDFPPVRACIFDMDGLLINSEDIITQSINQILARYGRPDVPGSIRAKMMGIPKSTDGDAFHDWADLPVPREQFAAEFRTLSQRNFAESCSPLPGARGLLERLSRARTTTKESGGEKIELALASTSTTESYELKSSNPAAKKLLDLIPPDRRVLGDDPRVVVVGSDGRGGPGGEVGGGGRIKARSKPAPDLYLIALEAINNSMMSNKNPTTTTTTTTTGGDGIIKPEECLVFEDSVIGVEAGRRAGMRVVWVPHPDLTLEYPPRAEKEVLAGTTGLPVDIGDHWQLGTVDDGWGERIGSLREFVFGKYGIAVPPE